MILETGVFLVIHSVEIAQIYSQTIFSQKITWNQRNYKEVVLIEAHCCYCSRVNWIHEKSLKWKKISRFSTLCAYELLLSVLLVKVN